MTVYSPEKYQAEKASGIRAKSGHKIVKKLKPIYVILLELHLRGLNNRQICTLLESRGIKRTEAWISQILNYGPLREIADKYLKTKENELNALTDLGVDAVRRGLMDPDARVSLKASDQLWKIQGRYKQGAPPVESAEDVVKRIIQMQLDKKGQPNRVTITEEHRRGASRSAIAEGEENA